MRLLLAILIGGVLALITGVPPANAHAVLLETTPGDGEALEQAPETAELQFNEPVQLIEGAIRLFPSDGDSVTLDAHTRDHAVVIFLPDRLADGTYALSYRIVSADGHPVGGAITFHIGEASSSALTPDAETVTSASADSTVTVLTVIQYLGLLVFAGLLFFHNVVMRHHQALPPGARRLTKAALWGGAAASVLLLPASALRITGKGLGSILNPDSWLPGMQWPPILVAAIAVVTGSAAYFLGARVRSVAARVSSALLAATATSAPVLVGHSRTREPGWLMIAADISHLVVAAFWTGGVIGLLLFIASASPRRGGVSTDVEQAAQATARFSRFALYSVLLLALSGTVMTVLILDAPEQLVSTGYGLTLLLKLSTVLTVIALAAWNRTRLLPHILSDPLVALRWATLKRILSYEAALIITVIAITGYLGNSSPSHDHHHAGVAVQTTKPQERSVRIESQGLVVVGTLSPGTPGPNALVFSLSYDGEPVTTEDVLVSARLPAQQLGPITAATTLDTATGEYESLLTLPVRGEWQVEFTTRISTYDQPIAMETISIQ
ncbi:copper resistance CopC/CopD family protein [Microbacterium sp. YY-01]|uniref:copper resistance CopC/CopD family protein n=1 Tax=Microbacterium sp. YY-01 TaxID=3421634 RepID=UPI003D1634C7